VRSLDIGGGSWRVPLSTALDTSFHGRPEADRDGCELIAGITDPTSPGHLYFNGNQTARS